MSTIVIRQLTFGFDGAEHTLFRDLDLIIDSHWRTAIVGANGRGKTTLLRLLSGELTPHRGGIECSMPMRRAPRWPDDQTLPAWDVALDAAGPFRHWELEMAACLKAGDELSIQQFSVVQNRYQNAGGYEIAAKLERELSALDLSEHEWARPFASLSGGEQTRCLLAGLFVATDTFALIDEPTNHLDRPGRVLVADYLATKSGFLLVSHDRHFLDACIDHVIALNADSIETRQTTFSAWRAAYHQRLHSQALRNKRLKGEIRALEETALQRRAGAHKREADKTAHVDKGFIGARAARQMKRALAAEQRALRAAQAREDTLVDVGKNYALELPKQQSTPTTGSLVIASNLVVKRGEPLFAPVTFSLSAGDRLALSGRNGCGKTTLMDLLEAVARKEGGVSGPVTGDSSSFERKRTVSNVSYDGTLAIPGHVTWSRVHQTARWRSGLLRDHLADLATDESHFRQIMAALGVRGRVLEQPLESLSDGQLKKLEIARSLLEPADILLWDEPLNFLDIDARENIEEMLLQGDQAMIFIEHDAAFVERIATSFCELV